MSAYFIATPEEMRDLDAMTEYEAHVPGIIEAFGGEFLVPQATTRTLEGDWHPGVMILIKFPSMDRLLEFYDSAEYRPWRELRHRSAKTSIVVTEGA